MSDRLSEAQKALRDWRSQVTREDPPSLFDAENKRDVALNSVHASYRGEVLQTIDRALERVIATKHTFTVDDLRDELHHAAHLPGMTDLRVLGAVLRRAARKRKIRAVDWAPSKYRHASPVRVWSVID
jgi:hypothetical protein